MKNKVLKKVFLFVLMIIGFSSTFFIKAANTKTLEVHFHYYRFDQTYAPWDMWIWQSQPTSEGGKEYKFIEDSGEASLGGVKAVVKLEGDLANATALGFLVRKPDWSQKDIDNDRFIEIKSESEGGIQHVYLVQGDPLIGHFLGDPQGPSKSPKFTSAYFSDVNKILFRATEELSMDKIRIFKDDVLMTFLLETTDNGYVATLNESVDFSSSYKIEATFSDDSTNDLAITYDGIYDSKAFEEAYYYDGDLGVTIADGKTTFRLWAPISSNVELKLYNDGTATIDGGSSDALSTHPMIQGEKGTWYITFDENMHNKYYNFLVTNGAVTHEVVDPYAVSTGVNGRRGLVVDFDQVNPEGWQYNHRANNMTNHTDAIIYELHVRDLTIHDSWNGTEANRGKFLGLIEKGTTYQNYKTGFDHILDLGVTHIQLLPFFDYGVVDETKLNDKDYNAFNWGYMPLHFNVPEGSFSSNPYDGLTRVRELKQVAMAYTENNIRLNMDVVYNHTGLSADSNFNLIIPGYYHRKTESGAFSNGSGTGNETASERAMMRKFMIDSLLLWTKEYNISGYRFDLMALHDLETMNQIYDALQAVDPTIMVYGEPWMGGSTPLPASDQAGKANLHLLKGIGAFNDDFRDAMKGSVFNVEDPGFVQGMTTAQVINRVKYGVVGGIEHPSVVRSHLSTSKAWHTEPGKTINYVTAHDNNTLHDKLYQTNEITNQLDLIGQMAMQAYSVLMTSQGVAFMHAGDEILRSKPRQSGTGFDHNSYESPDAVNQIRWDQKVLKEQSKVYERIKTLIAIRKAYNQFRFQTKEEIQANVSFLYEDYKSIIAYNIKGDQNILVIHNNNPKSVKITLPKEHGYDILVNNEIETLTPTTSYKANQPIRLKPHESMILLQNNDTELYKAPFPWLLVSIIGIVLIASSVGVILVVRKVKMK